MRPPQLRCVFFSSMYLPHLLVLPATFWTSVPFATLSVFPSLICGSCPSGQRFAYSFFQIPSHGGHPCCSAMCFVVAYAHLGLSPIRNVRRQTYKKAELTVYSQDSFSKFYLSDSLYPCEIRQTNIMSSIFSRSIFQVSGKVQKNVFPCSHLFPHGYLALQYSSFSARLHPENKLYIPLKS